MALVAATACGSDGGGRPADAALPTDARTIDCATVPAEVGTCVTGLADAPCDGSEGTRRFAPLSAGDELSVVIGPQGAPMFVIAARTEGIDPGDPMEITSPDNPLVKVHLRRDGQGVALLLANPPFVPSEDGDSVENAGLFVVVGGTGQGLDGATVEADVEIRDRNGEFRCGTAAFTARVP